MQEITIARWKLPGSFLGFLNGTNFAPMAKAIGGPNIKPLASIPAQRKRQKKKKRHLHISKHVSRDKLVQTSLILNIETDSYNNLQNSNINTLCNYCYKKCIKMNWWLRNTSENWTKEKTLSIICNNIKMEALHSTKKVELTKERWVIHCESR